MQKARVYKQIQTNKSSHTDENKHQKASKAETGEKKARGYTA